MTTKTVFDKTLWLADMISIAETNEEKDMYMDAYRDEDSWVNKCHNEEIMCYDALTSDYIVILNKCAYHVYEVWCRKVVEN